MIKIKAVNLISSKEFVKQGFGEEGLRKVISLLSDEDKKIIDRDIILSNEWISLDAWIRFFEIAIRELAGGNENFIVKAGEFNAEKELRGIYRVVIRVANPEFVANRCPTLIKIYFYSDEGKIESKVKKLDKNKFVISAGDFKPQHRILELGILGWLKKAFEINGAKNVDIKLTKSLMQGDGSFECSVSWE